MNLHTLKTKAGAEIVATVYKATGNRTLILASATGVKQSFYQAFCAFMVKQGLNVITFDYHGIGESLPIPIQEIKTHAEEWGSDNVEAVIQLGIDLFGMENLFLLGHSIGGQLIGLAPSAHKARKIILVGAQSGYWKFWNGPERAKLWILWHIIFPTLTNLFGYLPSRSFSKMENLPKGVATQWRQWCVAPNYLFDNVAPNKCHFNSVTSTVISFSVDDDDLAPKAAVDWLAAAFKNAKVQRRHLFPIELGAKRLGHFGFFSKTMQNQIWQPLANELQQEIK